jgi:hypothetical protein
VHDETLAVAAMRVNNPDCSPAGINRLNALSRLLVDIERQSGSDRCT